MTNSKQLDEDTKRSQHDWLEFVSLEGKAEAFDMTRAPRYWDGEMIAGRRLIVPCHREDERLYLTEDGRYVLVYWFYHDPELVGPPWPFYYHRELTEAEASLWLIIHEQAPGPLLKPVPLRDPANDPSSRLNRDWRPQPRSQLGPIDASPGTRPEEDRTTPKLEATNECSEISGIDFKSLEKKLARAGKPTQAALVRSMADKEEASAEDIARDVHGDSSATEKAMRMNASRTNDWLVEHGVRVRFRLIGGTMYKRISPE